ncbi:MAG: methyltransferase protein [Chthonomonadaceae bacterium]|nr:methyltransferase protein [Chthonomonadaceae bacterium]
MSSEPGEATTLRAPDWKDRDDFRRMRDVLDAIGYTHTEVCAQLQTLDIQGASDARQDLWRRRARGDSPREILIRLFLLGLTGEEAEVRRALAPMTLEQWLQAGLLLRSGEQIWAAVHLLPAQGQTRLIYDFAPRDRAQMRPDYVMGVGASSRTLANLTVRRPDMHTTTLDLGTGCGYQAFLAAAHSTRVVATDRNPRAVAMVAFNAALNGLDQVVCVEGDLFAPVVGQTFDLIVSNPPFVISPSMHYIFRDSGLPGDALCRQLVREAPEFLAEGGYCQILCNWAHITGYDWRERLAEWAAGIGCDVWVMRSETQDAAVYATTWIEHTEGGDRRHTTAEFDAWMEYYAAQGIEAVSAGLITLRKARDRPHWFQADDAPTRMLGPCGAAIDQAFAARDFLLAIGEEGLLEQPLKITPSALLETRFAPTSEGWALDTTHLRLREGLAYEQEVPSAFAGFIAQCREGQRPGELLDAMDADAETRAGLLDGLRLLIARGFLLPV